MEEILLVNREDEATGYMEKLEAHKQAKLHRAFSIFIFNSKKEMLLQKRAISKYHCGGLWTNTCCSHERKDETLNESAKRRLFEEMGIKTDIFDILTFHYKVEFDNGLTENEMDHIYIGNYDKDPIINPEEADEYKWITFNELNAWINHSPNKFTPWFLIALEKLKNFK